MQYTTLTKEQTEELIEKLVTKQTGREVVSVDIEVSYGPQGRYEEMEATFEGCTITYKDDLLESLFN